MLLPFEQYTSLDPRDFGHATPEYLETLAIGRYSEYTLVEGS